MKDQEIDDIIAEVKRLPLPSSSGSLESNVLRRIRLTRKDADSSLWAWLTSLLPKPALVAATLALVVSISSGITVVTTTTYTAGTHDKQLAASALDFGVFDRNDILNFDAR